MKLGNKLLIIVVLTIIFYSILIMISDLGSLYTKITHFRIEYLPIILVFIVLGWILFFIRWILLLRNLKINIPIRDNLIIYFSGFAVGFTPGRIGELFKSQLLKEKYGISRTKTGPIVIVERLYDAIGAIAASSVGIIVFPVVGYVILPCILIIVTILFLISSKTTFNKIINTMKKIRFLTKLLDLVSDSYETMKNSTRGKIAILCVVLSTASWFVTSLAVYFIFISYGTQSVDYVRVTSTFTASSILGALSFIPGGVGITDGSFTGFLKLLNLDNSSIIILVILVRIFTLWLGVIVGFIVLKMSKLMSLTDFKS